MASINFSRTSKGVQMRVDAGRGRHIDVDLTVEQYIEMTVTGALVAGLPTPWKG